MEFHDQIRSQAETEEIPTDEDSGLRDGDPELVKAQKLDQEIRKKAEAEIARENLNNNTSETSTSATNGEEELTNSGRPRRKVGNYRNQAPVTPEPPRDEKGNAPVTSRGEHVRYMEREEEDVEVDGRF